VKFKVKVIGQELSKDCISGCQISGFVKPGAGGKIFAGNSQYSRLGGDFV
jgi:hypothetical protein|tara:strand:- start:1 stop:150 length:150 start_codon:yes stop_codon:yes gene_type:complete